MDRPLRQSRSCCGIKTSVLGAALSLSWPLPATGAAGRPPPPTSALWGFGPESWCQWHQRGCREVNCAATRDDRSCHSIRSGRDRQAPEHNPPCVAKLPGSSASLCSFVKSNWQWQGGKRTLCQSLEGSAGELRARKTATLLVRGALSGTIEIMDGRDSRCLIVHCCCPNLWLQNPPQKST